MVRLNIKLCPADKFFLIILKKVLVQTIAYFIVYFVLSRYYSKLSKVYFKMKNGLNFCLLRNYTKEPKYDKILLGHCVILR